MQPPCSAEQRSSIDVLEHGKREKAYEADIPGKEHDFSEMLFLVVS